MPSRTSTPQLGCAPHELARDAGGVGDPVLGTEDCAEHVPGLEAGDERGIDTLDGHAQVTLKLQPLVEGSAPVLGRGEEQVADLVEVRWPELLEEADALLRQPDLGGGGELLPDAAHRARRRLARDLAAVAEDDVARAAQREVVGDARADRARSGYHDAHGWGLYAARR